ncbi:MAG: pyrimidine-nucleoside phosphorylase, partial [Clostridia bacterium]|nr:pyrimidine-nucleoside phosphorylase [Clostridia bacterium]
MVEIGEEVGRETAAFITNMEQPLGTAIGNALEVEEAILTLQGKSQGPLRELSLYLGAAMLVLAKRVQEIEEGKILLEYLLDSGAALEKFAVMIQAQGGNSEVVKNLSLLPQASGQEEVKISQEGFVASVNAEALGLAAMALGAGRENKDSSIDLAVGIKVHVRKGERVCKGQPLLTLFYNEQKRLEEALKITSQALQFSSTPLEAEPLIYGLVTKKGEQDLKLSF